MIKASLNQIPPDPLMGYKIGGPSRPIDLMLVVDLRTDLTLVHYKERMTALRTIL